MKAYLDTTALDDALLEDLLGHLRRFSGFILRYPDAGRELSRDEFLNNIREYVLAKQGAAASTRVASEIGLLLQIERGYRSVLAALADAAISKLPAASRVAACLNWALLAYAKVTAKYEESFKRSKEYAFQSSPTIDDEEGRPLSVDAAVDAILKATSTTLVMESYRNGWHNSAGIVTLPSLPAVAETDVIKAVVNARLAMSWSRWQRTEERRRFLGGSLREFVAPMLPPWAPNDITAATEYPLNDDEFLDFAANERLVDRLSQQLFEILVETDVEKRVSGIDGEVPLIPVGFVSIAEAHAALTLCDILKYEITQDAERPGGLRILEWLRGYAILQQLAHTAQSANSTIAGLVSIQPRADLLAILKRCGLQEECAAHFIDSVTFRTTSDDLYDSPLIALNDGRLLLFGPAALHTNLSAVVLSNLATLQQSLSRKGHALEADALSLLTNKNLHARGFRVTRDGEEYEYDAVLIWDEYVFVFECKNRSLSRAQPINAYFFDLGIRVAVEQVRRLAEALQRYPDILAKEMQSDLANKHVIPVVLNSLPYARIGDLNGVYCTDSSILDRFFSERFFYVKVPHRIRANVTVMHRIALTSLWAGNAPKPSDFLKQLKEPAQLKLLKGHTRQRTRTFHVGATHVVSTVEHERIAWSIESISRVFGLLPKAIRKEINAVQNAARRVRKGERRRAKGK